MAKKPKWRCKGCHRKWHGHGHCIWAPMLTDEVWLKFAGKDDLLCWECLQECAAEQRIKLTLRDLRPCPFNLGGWPKSWFNVFASNIDPDRGQCTASAQWERMLAGMPDETSLEWRKAWYIHSTQNAHLKEEVFWRLEDFGLSYLEEPPRRPVDLTLLLFREEEEKAA
jgi:hypothetical protein